MGSFDWGARLAWGNILGSLLTLVRRFRWEFCRLMQRSSRGSINVTLQTPSEGGGLGSRRPSWTNGAFLWNRLKVRLGKGCVGC